MSNFIFYTIVSGILLSTAMYIIFIPVLKRLKGYQFIRKEGPKSHYNKNTTPTMGGIIFIAVTSIIYLLTKFVFEEKINFSIDTTLIFFPFIGFGLIGLVDDLVVIIKKNNNGLMPRLKLLLQIIVASIYFYIYLDGSNSTSINLFGKIIELGPLYGILILLILVGSSNAVNLTDGLDGLAAGVSLIVILGFVYLINLTGRNDIVIFGLALGASLFGFLIFNFNPAKIFMGDTGSLALGAAIGSLAILSNLEILLLIIGFTYILETLSVIIQVAYFKKTRGKRIFKMTPIHHHFELSGMKEKEVVIMFYVVTMLFTLVGVLIGINVF